MSKRPRSSLEGSHASDSERTTKRRLELASDEPAGEMFSSGSSQVLKRLSYPSITNSIRPIKCPPFQLPSRLINFSYTPEHVLEFTNSAMKYFVEPPLGAQLSYGYDRWIRRPEERGRIDSLLEAYSKVKKDENLCAMVMNIGAVSWRGVMTRIMIAPYEQREGWDMNVMCVNGTMYLEEHLSDEKIKEKNDMPPNHRRNMYFGYSFESFCTSPAPTRPPPSTSDVPGHPPGWGGDVDTNVQWCNVMRTKLGDMRMVIGGEVDCIRASTKETVELKTSMTIRGPHDEKKFEQKLLKFYFQSFLLGVPEIIVGFRTPSGEVKAVEHYKTMEIPRMVRGKPSAWDPSICLDWGHRFFMFLKELILGIDGDKSDGKTVWRVKFLPGHGVTVAKLDEKDVLDVVAGEERVGFLPRWYWEEIGAPIVESKSGNECGVATVGGWQV